MFSGKLLKEIRLRKNMTQAELASKADIHTKSLSFYETGKGQPSGKILDRLASALGCSPAQFDDQASKLFVDDNILSYWPDNTDIQFDSEDIEGVHDDEEGVRIIENYTRGYIYRHYLSALNKAGLDKVVAYIQDLKKIPEYTAKNPKNEE